MQQTIRLKTKITSGDLQLSDIQQREIIFDNNKMTLIIKNNEGNKLVYFPNLDDSQNSINNTWSQNKIRKKNRRQLFLSL